MLMVAVMVVVEDESEATEKVEAVTVVVELREQGPG